VMLTNASLLHGSRSIIHGARYTRDDSPLIVLPLHHAGAQIHQLLPTYVLGGRAIVTESFSPRRFFAQALEHGATTSAHFAATLRLLLRRGPEEDARSCRLRHITFAQSLTSREYQEWYVRFGVPLQQLWGMTETSGLPIMSPIEGDRRLETMGRQMDGFYEVEVRREDDSAAAPGEHGEIVVRAHRGENVMLGYFRNPEATAATLRDGWIRTGDSGYRDASGFFQFVGRGADLIRRAGQNLSAVEVENVLLDHSDVLEAAVIGVPDKLGDQKVAAFVVPATSALTSRQVRDHCRANLASYKRPDVVCFVPALPRTAVGKIQKHLLTVPE
jgi:carnitine-CoA ligase